MDQSAKMTAAEIINGSSQKELERIFKELGEERFSHRIAKAIAAKREHEEIQTTGQLKQIVEKAIPTWKKRESVTRIFQALRIAVNNELVNLEKALKDAIDLLNPGGRIVVIAYHSLEDRISKHALRTGKAENKLRILTKKPVQATPDEIASNPRARSAKLRAAERT
jgi:16S rRNA (cytosine1402-N4)-methyltransferase